MSNTGLYLSIINNNFREVMGYLANGGDPNARICGITPECSNTKFPITSEGITPLHIAVINCARRIQSPLPEEAWDDSFFIVDSLIRAGGNLHVELPMGIEAVVMSHQIRQTPLDLALVLFERHLTSESVYQTRRKAVIAKLTAPKPPAWPTTTILSTVAQTYEKLLFSSNQSNVTFVCTEGEAVPAHKAILAAGSPYFAAAFDGPWEENNTNGQWTTSHPSPIIKAVLTFIYTGDIKGSLLEDVPLEMLSIAVEFHIDSLKEIATIHCVESIDVDNFKATLQLAALHSLDDLKQVCYKFAKKNMAKVLTHPDVMNLANEDKELWNEFKSAIDPDSK